MRTLIAHAWLTNVIVTILLSSLAQGEVPTIDGVFADWSEQQVVATDHQGDASELFDITKVAAATSGTELYLHFDIGSEINLQSGAESDGSLRLVVALPHSRQLTIDFRERSATLNSEPGKAIPWSQFGFVCLPTYASDRYELRLNLAKFGVQPGDTVKIDFTGSDELDEPVSIVLQKGNERHPEVTFDRTNTGDIRIANLNTLRQGMSDVDRSGSIKRLLTAAKADIFCFQEEWEEAKFREAVPRMVPSDQRVNLHWSNGCGIATSLPLEQIPMQLDRGVAAMIELPESNPLVVVSIHLKCCGFAGSREDLTRVYQAQQLVDEIRKLRHGEYGDELKQAGIVILGDYNLVGSRKPLDILRNAGLTDKILLIAGDGAAFTWRGINPEESFWPGRLDIVTYDHVVLRLSNGFLVDTSKFSEKALRVLGVRVHDSKASDHLMLIADFQLLR